MAQSCHFQGDVSAVPGPHDLDHTRRIDMLYELLSSDRDDDWEIADDALSHEPLMPVGVPLYAKGHEHIRCPKSTRTAQLSNVSPSSQGREEDDDVVWLLFMKHDSHEESLCLYDENAQLSHVLPIRLVSDLEEETYQLLTKGLDPMEVRARMAVSEVALVARLPAPSISS